MALVTPIIYGKFEYAKNPTGTGFPIANLYAAGTTSETFVATFSESITMSDSEVFNVMKALADALSLSDAQTKAVFRALSESLTMTETFHELASNPLFDSITITDTMTIRALKGLNESLVMSDSISFAVAKAFSESLTLTEVFRKLASKSFAETISMTDIPVTFRATKVLVDFLIIKEWISLRLLKNILWINPSANENSYDTLYGRGTYGPTLYGARLYGGRRGNTGNWGLGQKRQEAWTNVDGHKYNI